MHPRMDSRGWRCDEWDLDSGLRPARPCRNAVRRKAESGTASTKSSQINFFKADRDWERRGSNNWMNLQRDASDRYWACLIS